MVQTKKINNQNFGILKRILFSHQQNTQCLLAKKCFVRCSQYLSSLVKIKNKTKMKKSFSEIKGLALSAKQMKELKGGLPPRCPSTCGPNGYGECFLNSGSQCNCLYRQQVGDTCS